EGHRQRGRLLLLTFLGETRKVSRPPGRDPAYGLKKKSKAKKNLSPNKTPKNHPNKTPETKQSQYPSGQTHPPSRRPKPK
ncbi:hypothetical protein, partial [Variovorax sp.]|uniref:hypothetical protein n=1 Tax=Variovorax sp. TaxID=1871043 RepID=UPI0025CFDFFC